MSPSQIVVAVMLVFFFIGAVDRCIGGKLGLSGEFERGFSLMGNISLSILGLTCIAPALADLLAPVVTPIYSLLGADPAMFSGTILSPDSGGYAIAAELAQDSKIALFGGLVVACTMGATISFTIPTASALVAKEDMRYLAVGILCGYSCGPVGCFVGGLMMGLSPIVILKNLVPVIIIAVLFAIGLLKVPNAMIKGFRIFSRILTVIIMVGLCLVALDKTFGVRPVANINPLSDGLNIVGSVIIVLAGALPFIKVLLKVAAKPFDALSKKIKMSPIGFTSALLSLSSIVPLYAGFGKLTERDKVISSAFAASGAFILGAHLGFTSAIDAAVVMPMIVSKLVTVLCAIPLSVFFCKRIFKV